MQFNIIKNYLLVIYKIIIIKYSFIKYYEINLRIHKRK